MPVCLPWQQRLKQSNTLGQFYVAGWGQSTYFATDVDNLDRFGVLEPNMLYAQLPIVPNNDCNAQLGNVHPDYHVCAGGVLGKKKTQMHMNFSNVILAFVC